MKILFSMLLVFLLITKVSAIALGDWERDTPYGNKMSDPGSGTNLFIKKTREEINGIRRWYFYKGYTLGEYDKGYFIADERKSVVKRFRTEQEWQAEVAKAGLKPRWTRWYQDDWRFFDDLPILMLLAFYITIPLFIVISIIVLKAIYKEHLNPRKPFTLVVMSIVLLTALRYYLETNPVSL